MKCPNCGYVYGTNKKQQDDLSDMLMARDEKTRKLIRKVHRDITKVLPSDRMLKSFWSFMKGTNHIENRELRRGINQFYKSNHLNFGRGLAYLKAIIVNQHLNKNKQKELERKRLGSAPPLRKVK
tara:strand:+ start:11841 stop:12215 length:375 start_codon:yes stop_codon:yes gene_type:complete